MLADKLRKAVLQAAIQGKLTEQLETDGNAADLVAEIKKEKERLIKEKKLKKQKPLPEITAEEIPFEIPDNWCWVRLGNLASLITDGTHKTPQYVDKGVPFISIQNISSGKYNPTKLKFITIEEHEKLIARCKPEKGDILLCRIGTLGQPYIVDFDFEFSIFVSLGLIKLINKNLNIYLKLYMDSPDFHRQINEVKVGGGTHTFKLNLRDVNNFLIPLPPLGEQERIVNNLKTILSKIEQLGFNEEKLSLLQKIFPDKLKKSLLQAAIQGKLTEQLSTDDNVDDLLAEIRKEKEKLIKEKKIKKQKPLPPITEEEIPFEIPSNWRWVRAYDILDVRDGTHDTPKYVIKGIPLVTSKNLDNGQLNLTNIKYISKEEAEKINIRSKVDINDILFAMIGTIGNPVIIKENIKMSIKNIGLFKLYNNSKINMDYIYYVLLYMQDILKQQVSSGVQRFVSLTDLRKMIIPLPPIKEQQRIIEGLDRLLVNIED